MLRAFVRGAMNRQIDLSIELFLVPANAPELVLQKPWYVLSLHKRAHKRVAHVFDAI